MRHHGGAEDAGGQQQAVGARRSAGTRPAARSAGTRSMRTTVRQEAEQDHPEQAGDGQLERPVAAALQSQQRERDDSGDHTAGEQRNAEQQVQRDRAADHLGQVGGDGHQLGLHPHAARDRAWEVVAAQLRQVAPGGQAQLGGQRLDQHRQQVGGDDHPEQQVAVLGAGGEVGGEVARVDVGDGRDEGRTEQGEPAQPTALTDLAGGRSAVLGCGHDVSPSSWSPSSTRPCTSRVSGPPSERRCPATRIQRGPPKGSCPSTMITTPGKTPSSPR